MCRTMLIWFVAVAFLGFVCSPDAACGQAVAPEVGAPVTVSAGPTLTGGVMESPDAEAFSVRESLRFAQAGGVRDAVNEESTRMGTEVQEGTTETVKKTGGPSTGAVIAAVIIGVALVVLAVAAAGSRGGYGVSSGPNLNFGK